MELDSFPKQPYEKYPIGMDFKTALVDAETISSCEVLATDVAGNDVSGIVTENPVISQNKVVVIVKNGVSGSKYKLSFRIITSFGYQYEDDILMFVKD